MQTFEQDKKSSRALILIISTFTYLLFGAYVFDLLESKADYELRDELTYIRYLLQKKYNFTTKDFSLFETIAVKSIPHKAGYQWKFAGAFYFSTVVITTVGYGHSAPETLAGRLFCMLFALAGIPLGLVMFQSIGERVNTMIASCLHRIRSLLRSCGFQILPKITPTHLIITSLSIGSTIILIGTYVFHRNERWTLFEAYYYCVITLSTIGFGDYVPLQKEGILQKDPVYVLFTLFFVLTGLAVFSACVNLLVLRFMASNTDPVSAAAREPPKTVVFELLASRTLASRSWDPQRKTSAYSSNYRASMESSTSMKKSLSNLKTQKKIRKLDCCHCFSREEKKKKEKEKGNSIQKIPYRVRMGPIENVEHLARSASGKS